jgi:raffinose/stachyose/melibiose transport system permease protein
VTIAETPLDSAGHRTVTPPHRRHKTRTRHKVVAAWVAYLVTFVILLPLLWVAVLSFEASNQILTNPLAVSHLSLANYRSAFATLDFLSLYKNTLIIAFCAVTVGLLISYTAAFALTRMVFKGGRRRLQNTIRYYFIAGLAVPVYILLFPVYHLDVQLHVFGSFAALILPYIAVSIPFNILLLTGFLADFPEELEQAAIIDGCGLFSISWRIVFPLMRPVVATLAILNLIYVWNEFPFAVTLINNTSMTTISLGVSQFQGQYNTDYGAMMASAVVVLVPQLVLFAAFQRQVISGMTAGASR